MVKIKMIRLLIAHPNEMITASLQMLLETTHDLQVVGVAHDSVAMVMTALRLRPNLIVLSADLHGLPAAYDMLQLDQFAGKLLFFDDQPTQIQLHEASQVASVAYCSQASQPGQLLTAMRTLGATEQAR